ncbi:hypothetical protein XENOCAPTIV_007469, partial [Xenoophorus captivus]
TVFPPSSGRVSPDKQSSEPVLEQSRTRDKIQRTEERGLQREQKILSENLRMALIRTRTHLLRRFVCIKLTGLRRRTVEVFKGIPFADVPGKWEKPKPHPGWEGVLVATKYRDRCLQVTLLQTKTHGSEDCLYLNIFVPHGLSGQKPGHPSVNMSSSCKSVF